MPFKTADLYDDHGEALGVVAPGFSNFGGRAAFFGPVRTVKCFEDNSRVKALANSPGAGAVMVVDAGGSMRCALVGDLVAAAAAENGWAGIVMYGCVRDSGDLAGIDLGIKALGTNPRKSTRRDEGQVDIPVEIGGVAFQPGDWVYSDVDGIVVSKTELPGVSA